MTRDQRQKIVTQRQIDAAIDLYSLFSCNDYDDIYCSSQAPHCENCRCSFGHGFDDCGHAERWDCARALLGTPETSSELGTRCYLVVASMVDDVDHLEGSAPDGDPGLTLTSSDDVDVELEVEALLREGWLPPGWVHEDEDLAEES